MYTPGFNSKSKGVSLIEVLIVMIIIAVGMLGLAGMQMVSIKQTTNSALQTQAMLLADDIVERMRANRNALFNGPSITAANYGKSIGSSFPTSAAASCSSALGCTPELMATADLAAWSTMIQNSLPVDASRLSSDTFICLDRNADDAADCDGGGSTFLIQLAWNEVSSFDGSTVQFYRMVFEP